MTIAKDFASKFAVAFVAAAMILTAIAPAVQAAAADDLQTTINDLLAQVADLQAQLGDDDADTTSASCESIAAPLTVGSMGASVTALQNRLIADGNAIAAGATGYFGAQTKAALAGWQAANNVSPAVGYYGPLTSAAMSASCTPADDSTDDSDDSTDDSADADLQGEASLDNFEINDADDTDVSEGDEEVEIAQVVVEFADGDAEVSRLDLAFTDGSGLDSDAWDTFDTISLWVDGDMIAEMDASSKDDYLGDEDNGVIRFSDLALVAMEDEEVEISVAATLQDNLDSDNLGEWDVTGKALRFFDADGVATTESEEEITDETTTFTIEVAGINEELKFSLGDNNPDSTDIVVDETSSTNGVTVLEYTIKAEDGDITLNELSVALVTSDVIGDVVSDIEIDIDGTTYSDDTAGATTGTSTTYTFDIDGDVTIDDGEEVTVVVMVDFKRQDTNYLNGTTIQAKVATAQRDATDAEGADDLGTSQFTGTAVGDVHNLVATGILVPVDGVTVSADTTGDNDQTGEFSIEFEVTAVEGDFYVAETAGTAVNTGVQYLVELGSGTSTSSGVLTSTGDEETPGVFTVRDGETETFTLTVTVDTSATTQARVTLTEVNYSADTDGDGAEAAYVPTPASDFRTTYKNINAN